VALREYAQRRGFEIIGEYRDEGISGSKDSRPALDRMMKHARGRKFDVVIVARFDRFARSVSHLLPALEEFNYVGIDFVSVSYEKEGRPHVEGGPEDHCCLLLVSLQKIKNYCTGAPDKEPG
jgi:DNA invertase Pin-like site-specific DNA recombinase